MNKEQKAVREFHEKFGFTINNHPTIVPIELYSVREGHTYDEMKELKEAVDDKNIFKIADALGDIIYFIYGTAVAYGIDMEDVIAEIHRSNMTKDKPEGGGDKKAVKGKNYTPPNIGIILLGQTLHCDTHNIPQLECEWFKRFGSCIFCPPLLDGYDGSVK